MRVPVLFLNVAVIVATVGGTAFLAYWAASPQTASPSRPPTQAAKPIEQDSNASLTATIPAPSDPIPEMLNAADVMVAAGKLQEAQERYLDVLLTVGPANQRAVLGLIRVRRRLASDDAALLRKQSDTYTLAAERGITTSEHYSRTAMWLLAKTSLIAAAEIEMSKFPSNPTAAQPPPASTAERRGAPDPGTPAASPPTSAAERQDVTVFVFPGGASVTVDGNRIGQAPVRLPVSSLAAGTHRVTASAPGRLTVTRMMKTPIGASADLFLPQIPLSEPPSSKGDLLLRVQEAFETGDAAQAATLAQELLADVPSITEARILQATALWLQGSWRDALAAVRAHISHYGETIRSFDAYVLLGLLMEGQAQYQEALTGYKLAVKVQPAYSREFQQAITATESGIQSQVRQVARNPSDAIARIQLGLMHEAKGRFKAGMAEFKAVLFMTPPQSLMIRTFPSKASVYVGDRLLGRSPILLAGPPPDEITVRVSLAGYADMRRAVKLGGRSEVLLVLLPTLEGYGRTKFAFDDIREGLRGFAASDWIAGTRHFVDALESDSSLIKLRVYIAMGYYIQGRFSDSLEAIRAYINVTDNDAMAMFAYALMGMISEEQARYQDALTAYKLALRLHPAIAPVVSLVPVGSDAEIAVLQEATTQTADDPRLYYRLGAALESKGRFQRGMLALRRALFSLAAP